MNEFDYNSFRYNEICTFINDKSDLYGYYIVLENKERNKIKNQAPQNTISNYYEQISLIKDLINSKKININDSITLINRANGTGEISSIPFLKALEKFKDNMNKIIKVTVKSIIKKILILVKKMENIK